MFVWRSGSALSSSKAFAIPSVSLRRQQRQLSANCQWATLHTVAEAANRVSSSRRSRHSAVVLVLRHRWTRRLRHRLVLTMCSPTLKQQNRAQWTNRPTVRTKPAIAARAHTVKFRSSRHYLSFRACVCGLQCVAAASGFDDAFDDFPPAAAASDLQPPVQDDDFGADFAPVAAVSPVQDDDFGGDFGADFGGDVGEDATPPTPAAAQPRGVGDLIAQLPDLSFMLQHSVRTQ